MRGISADGGCSELRLGGRWRAGIIGDSPAAQRASLAVNACSENAQARSSE